MAAEGSHHLDLEFFCTQMLLLNTEYRSYWFLSPDSLALLEELQNKSGIHRRLFFVYLWYMLRGKDRNVKEVCVES